MKRTMLFLFAMFWGTAFLMAQTSDLETAIKDGNDKMAKAMVNGDIQTLMGMYADDVISLPDFQPKVEGKQALQENMQKDMGNTKFSEVKFNTDKVMTEGNLAVEIGSYDMTMTMGKEPSANYTGKYITVWKKIGNDWKIAVETWNSDSMPKMKEEQTPEEQK